MRRTFFLFILAGFILPVSIRAENPKTYRKQVETNIECAQALSLFRAGKTSEAEKIYLDILAKDRNQAIAYDGLSRIHEEKGELGEAEMYSLSACGIEPLNPTYQGQLGIIYMKEDRLALAIEAFQHATQIKSYNTDKYFQLLADCLKKQNELGRAAEAELGRLRTRGWDDTIYVDAARKYYLAGDMSNGNLYKRMAGNAWEEYESLTVRQRAPQAWTAYKEKRYRDAARLFSALAKDEDTTGDYDRMAGLAYKKLKEPAVAEHHLKVAVEKNPGDIKGINELAFLLSELGRDKEAIIQYERAALIDSRQIPSLVGLAKAYSKEGKHISSARTWYRAYELALPARIKARYIEYAGSECIAAASSSPKTAKELSKKILPLLPEDSPSRAILKKLKEP